MLVERTDEIAALDAAIGAVAGGRGGVVAVQGAAGIGKSSLLAHACAGAAERGCAVLRARAVELERDLPWGVVLALFEPVDRAGLMDGAAALCAPLFDGSRLPPGDRVGPVVHGLYWLVAQLAERGPVVLAVDDLHLADDPSLLFFAYLSRRLESVGALLVAAVRPEHEQPDAVVRMLDEDGPRVLRPSALSVEGVRRYLSAGGAGPSDELVVAAHAATGGNPMLLHELVVALAEDGEGVGDPGAAEHASRLAPPSVARSVLLRLERLAPEATALARAMAVLGEAPGIGLVGRLADVASPAAPFDELVAHEVLSPGPPVRFVHPIVRQAVLAEVPPGEADRLHAAAAALLAGDPRDTARAAAHLLACSPAGSAEAVALLRRAARAALAGGAPRPAVELLRRALAEPPREEDLAAVLLELGRAEVLAGDVAAPDHVAEGIARLEAPGRAPTPALAAAHVLHARALAMAGRAGEAADLLEEVVAALDEAGDPSALTIECELAGICRRDVSTYGRVTGVVRRLRRRLTPGMDVPPAVLANLAFDAAVVGDAPAAVEAAERALGDGALVAREGPDSPTPVMAVIALMLTDASALAMREAAHGVAVAGERGSMRGFGLYSGIAAHAAYRLGDLAACEAHARAGLTVAREQGHTANVAYAAGALADVLIERGEPSAALALYAELGFDGDLGPSDYETSVRETRGRLRLALGDAETARADFARAARNLVAAGGHEAASGAAAWELYAALALGDRDGIAARAAHLVERARGFGAARPLGMALWVAGLAEDDMARLEEAVAVLSDAGVALEHARVATELGAALRRNGHRARARDELRAALDVADRCAATAIATRARDELRAAGGRPRRARTTGPGALTPSERRVAALAAEGRSNKQIAQALFVTLRTVEMHLTNAYAKLGVTSREELPAALRAD